MVIVLIAAIVIISFFVAFVYLIKNDKGQKDIEQVYENIKQTNTKIKDIAVVQNALSIVESETESKYIRIKNLNRIFKYDDSEKYWIEIFIENVSVENVNFNLDNIILNINNQIIKSNLIVLFEKVPEHYAPPYGNRYFNTEFYKNYMLGEKTQKLFRFLGRFELPNASIEFHDSDYIRIEVEFNKLENGEFIVIEKLTFIESLINMKFKTIQSIDDTIKWIN